MKAARFYRANPLIGVDVFDNKKDVVEALHGDLFINAANENIGEALRRELGIKEVDVVIDTSGNARSISNTVPLVGNDGRFIMVGHIKQGQGVELMMADHLFGGAEGKTIKATQGGRFSPDKDIPRFVKLYKAGLLDIDNLITHHVKLDDINEAIDMMRGGKANRIIINL